MDSDDGRINKIEALPLWLVQISFPPCKARFNRSTDEISGGSVYFKPMFVITVSKSYRITYVLQMGIPVKVVDNSNTGIWRLGPI